MTIRKIWLWVLTLVAVVSIGINALILTGLTDRHFKEYLTKDYDAHIKQIQSYAQSALTESGVSYRQMAIELETHLDDPIIRIKLYRTNGALLADVQDENYLTEQIPHGRMMSELFNRSTEAVEQYPVMDGEKTIAYLNVTRHSGVENSIVAQLFKSTLLMNSLFSVAIALGLSIIVGSFLSKRMSKALTDTAQMASDLHLGVAHDHEPSNIVEIKQIRDSLDDLSTRLKLKEKSRKALVDQLIHQTRTPLTILRTHLEAIEDGVIAVESEELGIFQNQIESLTTIIANMGGLIDAEREVDTVTLEEFELHPLLKQIMLGLQAQFDQKGITLTLNSTQKLKLNTDKYKLSQAVYNLLTNAYKYTKAGGQVDVTYTTAEGLLTLSVTDTGRGIAAEELDRIFEAYYRSSAATDTAGEGIGLYMVRENLSLLRGSVQVQSELGKGSRFEVSVPLVLEKEE